MFPMTWETVDMDKLLIPDTTRAEMELLNERGKTHGSFEMNAILSQRLKLVFKRSIPHYGDLCDVHKEALDMIALKISRILSGHANFNDHWDDIAGYAKLASDHCNTQKDK